MLTLPQIVSILRRVPRAEICRATGLHRNTVSRILNSEEPKPEYETVRRLSDYARLVRRHGYAL